MERRFSMIWIELKGRLLAGLCLRALSFLFALLICQGSTATASSELRLRALAVPYASPWQRATQQQEAEDGVLLLDAPEAGLQLAVLRPARALKIDAPTYYDRLTRNWRQLYGERATIDWIETGGQKWLSCQRAANDGKGRLWQLSTVFAEQAYSLILFVPDKTGAMPPLARDLLAAIRFDTLSTSSAVPAWVRTATLFPATSAETLAALVQEDIQRLGEDGLITGYGLNFGDMAVDWFIEGYTWKTVNERVDRVALNAGGQIGFDLPAESDGVLKALLRLSLLPGESDIGARVRVWSLCAAEERIAETLTHLQTGDQASLQALAATRLPGCPDAGNGAWLEGVRGESGKTLLAETAIALPPALDANRQAALQKSGLRHVALVEIALHAAASRTGLGGGMIERVRGYAVYEAGGPGEIRRARIARKTGIKAAPAVAP